MTAEELLAHARSHLDRVSPEQAAVLVRDGAVIMDIRERHRRERDGRVAGAVEIDRNVVEWRCDPAGQWRDERVSDPEVPLIVMCDEGYQSSLVAATLQRLGLGRATDMEGGFVGWVAEGLPVERS